MSEQNLKEAIRNYKELQRLAEELEQEMETVKDTIKVAAADGTVCATPERSTLRAIQTPQVFRLSLYKEALCLAKNAGKQYTDDCQLIEAAGGKVYLTPGDYKNIKITTPEDLLVAEAFAAEK